MKRLISNKKLLVIGMIIIIVIAVLFLLKNKSNNFTVSFETDGGTKIQDQVVKENSKIIKPTRLHQNTGGQLLFPVLINTLEISNCPPAFYSIPW